MKRKLRYIILAFSLSFITVSILSFISVKYLLSLIDFSNRVDHTNEVIVQLISIDRTLRDLDAQEREFIITGDSTYIRYYFDKYELLNRETKYLEHLIADSKKQQKTFVMLKTTMALRLYNFKKRAGYYNVSSTTISIPPAYNESKVLREESYMHIDKMMSREKALLKQRFRDKEYFQEVTSAAFKYVLIIFFMITTFLFGLMINELLKRMNDQDELQKNLIILQNSHAEMEQIAFASSHTFRELLRKIKIFGGRLLWLQKESADEETRKTIEIIGHSAGKMQVFLDELVNLAGLVGEHDYSEEVNLNQVVESIVRQNQNDITNSNTFLNIHELPVLHANKQQMFTLFKHLLIYPLKFKDTGIQSKITLTHVETTGAELPDLGKLYKDKSYLRINLLNSYAAFTESFIEDVLKTFQITPDAYKLPTKDFGLAIIRRIVANHHGFIVARYAYEKGIEFNIYLPVKK